MVSIKVDAGSVENGSEFTNTCDQINLQLGLPGIQWEPANVACQQENVVERAIQT